MPEDFQIKAEPAPSRLWGLELHYRRWLVCSLSVLFTSLVITFFFSPLFREGVQPSDLPAALIYGTLLCAGGFNLLLYIVGFFLWRESRKEKVPCESPPGENGALTAIVMPIYHEDVERVHVGIRRTWMSAKETGLDGHCDFFLLSDSTDPEIRRKEEEIYRKLLTDFENNEGERGRIFLLRREERKGYKAGNIANFLVKHGGAYDFMLVLDADSVMSGKTIRRLIATMRSKPGLALLQTVVLPMRSVTVFAKAMEFSLSRCMPLFGRGLFWFLGGESVYWGHNALIRIEPFMAHCNLPLMPGKPPLGGEIMSQDIVEAALLSRAGWDVEWDVDSGGSFDELPANLLTYGRRDRRWCQGNFQHFWLIFGDGIRFGQRLYFGMGILAYLSGPLLLILMSLGFVQGLRGREYEYDSLMFYSFIIFLVLVILLPRTLGFIRSIVISREKRAKREIEPRRQRLAREVVSLVTELVLSILLAPVLFYMHGCFVLGVLTGRRVDWKNQSRNPSEGLRWSVAARMFWIPTLAGSLWLVWAVQGTPGFLVYLAPVLSGWLLSIPLAVATSSPRLGNVVGRLGLFESCFGDSDDEALRSLAD